MQARTVTKSRDWAVALDDAQPPPERRGWLGLSMAAAGGVAVLAVAAGLMAPPSAPPSTGRAATPRPAAETGAGAATGLALPTLPPPATPTPQSAPDQMAPRAQAVPPALPPAQAPPPQSVTARLDAAPLARPPAGPQAAADRGHAAIDGRDERARAGVGETDLGLRVLPGSRPVPDSGRRVPDGAGGEAVALSLTANGTLDSAVQFYRQQWLAEGMAADAVQVLRPGDGQALLRTVSPQGGERTVWIVQNGALLDIVLARVRPGPSAPR